MNKEALRKELEDCWDASNDSFWWHTVANNDRPEPPDKSTYITTRLAALDDGDVKVESVGGIKVAGTNIVNKKDWVADGQEGKGLEDKQDDWWGEIGQLLLGENLRNYGMLMQEIKSQFTIIKPALPLADGEGEKVGAAGMIDFLNFCSGKFTPDDADETWTDNDGERYTPKELLDLYFQWDKRIPLLPSAVTGGVKWVKASERLPEVFPVSMHLKFLDTPFCYVGGFYQTTDGKNMCHIANHNSSVHINEDEFYKIEWLDEGQPAQGMKNE